MSFEATPQDIADRERARLQAERGNTFAITPADIEANLAYEASRQRVEGEVGVEPAVTKTILRIFSVEENSYNGELSVTVMGGTIKFDKSAVPSDLLANYRAYELVETATGTGVVKPVSYEFRKIEQKNAVATAPLEPNKPAGQSPMSTPQPTDLPATEMSGEIPKQVEFTPPWVKYKPVADLVRAGKTDDALARPELAWLEADIDSWVNQALNDPTSFDNALIRTMDAIDHMVPNDESLVGRIYQRWSAYPQISSMLQSTGLSRSVMEAYIAKRLQVSKNAKQQAGAVAGK